jgi:hypothetical protein
VVLCTLTLCVPKISSVLCDQVIFVDQTTDTSLFSDAVLVEINWLGQGFQRRGCVQSAVGVCVPRISSVAVTSRVALFAVRP